MRHGWRLIGLLLPVILGASTPPLPLSAAAQENAKAGQPPGRPGREMFLNRRVALGIQCRMTTSCCEHNHGSEHSGLSRPRERSAKIAKQGEMETQTNGLRSGEAAPAPTFADVALRVALWVVYGGAAGEMVYASKAIEDGMGASLPESSSRHPN